MKKCKLCGEIFKVRQIVNGQLRNFSSRKYCLKCSPFGSGNTRKLELGQVSKLSRKERDAKKYKKWQKKARKERKKKLVEMFGGSCPFCKYDKCYKSFDFHHLDPSKKDMSVSRCGMLTKWNTIIKEVKKCIMICANCHREYHAGLISDEKINKIYKDKWKDINSRQ